MAITFSLIGFVERLYFGKKIANLNIMHFIKNAVVPLLLPIASATLTVVILNDQFKENIFRLLLTFALSMGTLTFVFWEFSLKKEEISKIKGMITAGLGKLKQF